MLSKLTTGAMVLVGFLAAQSAAQAQRWDKDIGKPAPRLIPGGWVGTPVSLEVLRKTASDASSDKEADRFTVANEAGASGGNTVVLAFWNADIPC